MAEKVKMVTLYNPDNGTQVEVDEDRGEVLKSRGYTAKPLRNYTGPNSQKRSASGQMDDSTVSDLQAQLAAAQAEIEKLKGGTPVGTQTPPK